MRTKDSSADALVERFVASFGKLNRMSENTQIYPIAPELTVGEADEFGQTKWKPLHCATDASLLGPLYAKLPTKFPKLYERLILSYRWAEIDLETFRLLANPPGPDLRGLLQEMLKDQFLSSVLLKNGFVRFGKGPDMDYDPVCFDISSRTKNGDRRIVKLDHEEILCNSRIRIVREMAESFERLMQDTIAQGDRRTQSGS